MKASPAWMVLMVVAVLLAGCGEGGEATAGKSMKCPPEADAEQGGKPPRPKREVFISVNRYVGAESAGILMAQERGYFADAGLEVTVTDALTPNGPLSYVLGEVVDFGVAQQPEVVMAEKNGAAVIALGTLASRPTAALIWLRRSKIEEVSDLEGKTIAYSGIAFQRAFLQILLEEAGLTLKDVELLDVGHGIVPALVSGQADAAFGGTANVEGAVLEGRALEPVVTPVEDLGIPPYNDLVVITRSDRAAPDARLARAFMSAVARGNAAAVEDPREAVRAIEKNLEGDPNLGRKATEASVEATLPLLSPTGCIDLDQEAQLIDWMSEQGLIR
ncbi:MAG TPA: ABC transporter substrate-binding protein [Solirubrobacterales bacterium]|nr:ABC transporter substrate-binding protein [Solirubrobacterales bacterium]